MRQWHHFGGGSISCLSLSCDLPGFQHLAERQETIV